MPSQAETALDVVPLRGPSPRFFRVAALVGLIGTVTTASNITLAQFLPATGGDPLEAAELSQSALYVTLHWVLLVHALATLVPPVALAAVRFPTLLGAAGLGALFTALEKFTELVGQTVRVFVLNGTWRPALLETSDAALRDKLLLYQDQFVTVWNSMYFVLWVCGSLAAVCFAVTFWRSRSTVERWLARTATLVALLGALMTLSEYFGQRWAAVTHPAVYLVVMTAYRGLVAWTLWNWAATLARQDGRAPLPSVY